jgi:hypothetical protein
MLGRGLYLSRSSLDIMEVPFLKCVRLLSKVEETSVGSSQNLVVDPTARFLITASGDRGWQGDSTKTVLVHEIRQVD